MSDPITENVAIVYCCPETYNSALLWSVTYLANWLLQQNTCSSSKNRALKVLIKAHGRMPWVSQAVATIGQGINLLVIIPTVTNFPDDGYVSTPGGEASFTCITSGSADVQWLLNGSQIDTLNLSNAETAVDRSGGHTAWTLRLSDLSVMHNNTRIRCTDTTTLSSASTSLLLQGVYLHR